MKPRLLLALSLCAAAGAALAQEPISTRAAQQAPSAPAAPAASTPVESLDQPTPSQIEAAAWGRQVLDRAAGKLPPTDDKAELRKTAQPTGCERNPDRSPHGSAGVAVGTGGYRSADIFVTQPIGDCGQVSVGISTSRGGGYGRRYR